MTTQDFLKEIEAFLERHNMTPWHLSKHAVNDTSFVYKLRKGKGVTLDKAQKVKQFMRDYERDHALEETFSGSRAADGNPR